MTWGLRNTGTPALFLGNSLFSIAFPCHLCWKSGEHKCKHLFINPYFLFQGSLRRPRATSHRVIVSVALEEQSKSFQCFSFSELFQSFWVFCIFKSILQSVCQFLKKKKSCWDLYRISLTLHQFRENHDLAEIEFSNPYTGNVFPIL